MNLNLWNKFVTELEAKNVPRPFSVLSVGGNAKSKLLFHGTTSTDPMLVIESHEGLDHRFNGKNATMYGKGVYFHKESRYCHSYAHVTPSNTRIILLANVLVGNSVAQESDPTRFVPPLLPNSQVERYDSINNSKGMYTLLKFVLHCYGL